MNSSLRLRLRICELTDLGATNTLRYLQHHRRSRDAVGWQLHALELRAPSACLQNLIAYHRTAHKRNGLTWSQEDRPDAGYVRVLHDKPPWRQALHEVAKVLVRVVLVFVLHPRAHRGPFRGPRRSVAARCTRGPRSTAPGSRGPSGFAWPRQRPHRMPALVSSGRLWDVWWEDWPGAAAESRRLRRRQREPSIARSRVVLAPKRAIPPGPRRARARVLLRQDAPR